MNARSKKIIVNVLKYTLLLVFLVSTLFPFYWLFITSLKTKIEIHQLVPTFFPKLPTLQNYINMIKVTRFDIYIKNSLIVTMTSSVLVLVISLMGGYALARYKFKGKGFVFIFLICSQMIPMITAIIPMFIMYSKIGIINKPIALILSYTVSNVPFCLITASTFYSGIPVTLEEAAMIDGCSRFEAVRRIILPTMLPGVVAVFVFGFTGAWNELFYAVMMISSESRRTIPSGLMNFVQKYDIDWGQMSAAGMVTLIPVAIMFFTVQKYIVSGLTSGAVKE